MTDAATRIMHGGQMDHHNLQDAGQTTHAEIDRRLPGEREKALLATLAGSAPVTVSGARDNPEAALANLLTALETLGLIADNTTAT
jgi:transposase